MSKEISVAIVGVGNVASTFVQGVAFLPILQSKKWEGNKVYQTL